jgi:hypothetical protein
MPWTEIDADSHTQRADSPKLKRMWAEIADKELEASGDEGRAIKIANGVVKKQQAKKALDELMDLAKSFDFSDLDKATTYGSRKLPKFRAAGFQHMRFRKPGFKHAQFRHPKNMSHLSSAGKRNYKSIDAPEKEEKSIGTTSQPTTQYTVRAHKRVNMTKRNANSVTNFKRRRFSDPGQVRGVTNIQDM